MNIRKNVDYSVMFSMLDTLMEANLPQMELYYEIGRTVSNQQEKGAAVAAGEFTGGFGILSPQSSPDAGFLPRL